MHILLWFLTEWQICISQAEFEIVELVRIGSGCPAAAVYKSRFKIWCTWISDQDVWHLSTEAVPEVAKVCQLDFLLECGLQWFQAMCSCKRH
jgi:hypothetical protein